MKNWIFILILILLTACEKEQKWDYDEGTLPDIVVDGMFTNEYRQHEVFISLPVSTLNDTAIPVSGAQVRILDIDSAYLLTEDPQQAGRYLTDSTVHGIVGRNYTLEIVYNGKTYTASDGLHAGLMFVPLSLNMINEDSLYEISWVCSNYSTQDPALYEIFLDWRHLEGFDSISSVARLYYYTLTSLDVGQFLVGDEDRVIFPVGTKISERRYSISDEYAAFLREMLIETQYNSGLVNMIPANTNGNFSNGAAGFFFCAGVVEYTTVAGD